MEAYSDSFYTTGVTYQADNQPTPTTVKGAGVDVSTLNIIGLGGTLDWGVHAYDPTGANGVDPRNGGIVGSVSYDTTRNELDPQYAASEDWQPGVPGHPGRALRDRRLRHATPAHPATPTSATSSPPTARYKKGKLLNTYVSENWERPDRLHRPRRRRRARWSTASTRTCLALDQETDGECIPAFSQSVQFGTYPPTRARPDANFGAAVNGNYGFGDGCFNGTLDATPTRRTRSAPAATSPPSAAGDYLVQPRHPRRHDRQPDVQGDRRGGHQHRQRQPGRPAGAAAGVRRRPAHRRPRRRRRPTATPRSCGDGTNGAPAGVTVPASTPGRQRDLPRHRRLALRGHAEAALRHQAGRAQQRQVGRADVQRLHRRAAAQPAARPDHRRRQLLHRPQVARRTARRPACPFVPVGIYDFTNRL